MRGDFNRTKIELHAFSEVVVKEVSEADKFREILIHLKGWIPTVKEKTLATKPIDGDRDVIGIQIQNLEVSCY